VKPYFGRIWRASRPAVGTTPPGTAWAKLSQASEITTEGGPIKAETLSNGPISLATQASCMGTYLTDDPPLPRVATPLVEPNINLSRVEKAPAETNSDSEGETALQRGACEMETTVPPASGDEETRARSSRLDGFVESVSGSRIYGWAYDRHRVDVPVSVIAYAQGREIGRSVADGWRADLASAGIGTGRHAFSIDIAPDIALHEIPSVFAISSTEKARLKALDENVFSEDRASRSDMPLADESQFPVFILGPARSGTSAVAMALLKSGQYEGLGEGHLLPLALRLIHQCHLYYDERSGAASGQTLLGGVPIACFERLVRRGFVQLMRSTYRSGYWIDKTPTAEMVYAAPLLAEIWQNGRFILLKRRLIENLMSRVRKFPHESTRRHYVDWAAVMEAWLEVRPRLERVSFEVESLELATNPREMGAKIAKFVGLSSSEAADKLIRSLSVDRPEWTDAKFGTVHSLEHLGLSEAELHDMKQICAPVMSSYGYSFDESYFSS
jgi:hypothetical protein